MKQYSLAAVLPHLEVFGGIRRYLALGRTWSAWGHAVTLYASADSVTGARLVPCAPKALRLDAPPDGHILHVLELEAAYRPDADKIRTALLELIEY